MKPYKNDKKKDDEEGGGEYGDNTAGGNTAEDQRDLGKTLKDALQNNTEMLHDDLKNGKLVGKLKEMADYIRTIYEERLRKAYALIKNPKKQKIHNNTPKNRM